MTLIQLTNTVNFQISTVTAITGPNGVFPNQDFQITITNISANTVPANGFFQNQINTNEPFTLSWVLNGLSGTSGAGAEPFSQFYNIPFQVYDPNGPAPPPNNTRVINSRNTICLNNIGAWVGRIHDIENSIIGIKEPIYPTDINGDYTSGIGANWVRPEINNTATYISYHMYGNSYNTGFLDASSNWSRFKGPFDIVPVPLPTLDASTPSFADGTIVIYPDTSATQTIGSGQLSSFLIPTPNQPNTDPMVRLTQVYYVGCTMLNNNFSYGQSNYAFMTDCSAGTVGFPRQTKWPKTAPRVGFLIGAGSSTFNQTPSPALSNLVTQGEVFYVNVNFILQIEATQNEIPQLDDMALYGQVNYHPDRGDTTKTPYIDWVSGINLTNPGWPDFTVNVVDAAGTYANAGVSDPSSNGGTRIYGNPPMNILFKDLSSNNFLNSQNKLYFRPQYSGDLLWRGSSINPQNATIQAGSGLLDPSFDPSGAIYNIPIHWRAKCIIPKPSDSGTLPTNQYINWNGVTDASLNPATNPNATIYIALTMFNTAPEFGLNTRPFNYKVLLDPTNPRPIIGDTLSTAIGGGLGQGANPGNQDYNYGYSQWQSSSGFPPNFSVSNLSQI